MAWEMNAISTTLTQVSIGSSTNIWGVDAAHHIYHYTMSSDGTWTPTQIAGALTQVSVAADGTVWGVAPDNTIWHYVNNAWTMVSGKLIHVLRFRLLEL